MSYLHQAFVHYLLLSSLPSDLFIPAWFPAGALCILWHQHQEAFSLPLTGVDGQVAYACKPIPILEPTWQMHMMNSSQCTVKSVFMQPASLQGWYVQGLQGEAGAQQPPECKQQ